MTFYVTVYLGYARMSSSCHHVQIRKKLFWIKVTEKIKFKLYFRNILSHESERVSSCSLLFGYPVCFYAVHKSALKFEMGYHNALDPLL